MMVILTFSILWLIVEGEDGDILTFSILWLIGECDNGDWKQDQKNLLMNSFYSDGFDYIGL